jgi:16S rRNA (uracil1498-N3)-methyltransferase
MVFVDDLARPVLPDADAHHLRRVLRVRPGDEITVADGRGRWRRVRFADHLEVAGEVVAAVRERPEVAVGFALVKGTRPELIVQKLTELGIDRIVPFQAERSVVRWDDVKVDRAHGRLEAVARSAAAQSHRPWLPIVEPATDLAELAARPGAAMADRDGVAPTLDHPLLLVGPEGGWSSAERALGLPTVRLGAAVLRAETAALTAGALLTALRAGVVGPTT